MHRRIVACGRGRVTQLPVIRKEVIALTGKQTPSLVYIGAATYEDNGSFELQTKGFVEDGCQVQHLKLTDMTTVPPKKELETIILNTDIVLFSGGNTLFAMTRLRRLKMDIILKKALEKGVVMCGGSAGALSWFDGGLSDSKDPTTLRHPRPNLTESEKQAWKYIRVSGFGFVRGLCCPHHDITQSNGVPRATEFDALLQRFPEEVGVAIDDHAAILINGNQWKVLSAADNAKVAIKRVEEDGSVNIMTYEPGPTFYPTDLFERNLSVKNANKKRKRL